MAKKNAAEVLINGKVYTIGGHESTAYLHRVASYLNEMEEQVSQLEGYRRMSPEEKQLLKNMNLADVYFKASDARDKLEREAEQKDKELYGLKHDLIDASMEREKLEARIQELESRLREQEIRNQGLLGKLEEYRKREVRSQQSAANRHIEKPETRL